MGQDIYGQTVWGVKSGTSVYAADRWVVVEANGQPAQELAHGQWLQTQVEAHHDTSLVLGLDKLVFRNGKTPPVPGLSILHEGDPNQPRVAK